VAPLDEARHDERRRDGEDHQHPDSHENAVEHLPREPPKTSRKCRQPAAARHPCNGLPPRQNCGPAPAFSGPGTWLYRASAPIEDGPEQKEIRQAVWLPLNLSVPRPAPTRSPASLAGAMSIT